MSARFAVAAALVLLGCHARMSLERPGLGTEWGESRFSSVRDVAFERESHAPLAQATMFYDDREGVSAALGGEDRAATRASVAARAGLHVEMVGDRGGTLPARESRGRLMVFGATGQRYFLRISNRTARRYEVVASVDGLDVIDGLAASWEKCGYLVQPYGTLVIDGFRKSQWEVAAFRFGAVADSYAARTGDDANVGVIGVAFFGERDPQRRQEAERRLRARPFAEPPY